MTTTTRQKQARFAFQMADQARKFGARVAELRGQREWTGKELVAAMAELGDLSINTNQLSRYENGGTMPGELRQERFAQALGTTVGDLIAGPEDEREEQAPVPDPFADPEPIQRQLAEIIRRLDIRTDKGESATVSLGVDEEAAREMGLDPAGLHESVKSMEIRFEFPLDLSPTELPEVLQPAFLEARAAQEREGASEPIRIRMVIKAGAPAEGDDELRDQIRRDLRREDGEAPGERETGTG